MRKRYGGFENVGAMVDECKNFKTRINSYIREYDTGMVINRLTDKKQYLIDFSFEYSVDEDKRSFGRQPKVVVTDQDPAMKQAIDDVFTTSRHRLCMWHIMKKVADKVGHELCNNDDFKRKMCDIVWTNSIEPEEFERQWKLVANSQLTLVEFMNHFDGAMDVQRFNHRMNDHISRYTEPDDWGKTTLQKDAAKIYTMSIFFDQQTEIYGTITECLPMDTKIKGPRIRISLKDFKAHGDGLLEVCFKNLEDDMFGVREIPNKYVMKRWTKDVVPNELNATFDVKVDDKDEKHKAKQIAREIIYTWEYLVSNLISDLDQLVLVRDQMKQIKEKVDQSRITKQLDPKFDRHKGNEVEDDEEEDEFEDYGGGSDDGREEDEWEEVSDEED
ncbi:protein FAR1-RELATED SEQUENCE 1-like [Helianthus annuus]|uniref:protein FAR1-RELATED SEQUENCE 1-like n=1 Tax=Helianthus annuus TaxID=4232 RepID=UPI000B9036DD|nr:protein FAR1-RELATED SEQUENCE 1-like [Helianthus annuus]